MRDLRRILVALDFSPPSREAACQGFSLARRLGAEVAFLHVVDVRYMTMAPSYLVEPPPLQQERLERQALARLESMVRDLSLGEPAPLLRIRSGVPGDEILLEGEAWKADLVVMGTHGRTGLKRAFMGSQAEVVVRRARIPILVVHAEDEAPGAY